MQSWHDIIGPLKQSEAFTHAWNYQHALRAQGVAVYPPENRIFSSFAYTPLEKLSAVIIGQDPYHEPEQAMGLSFSVPPGVKVPPSLRNIYKELAREYPEFKIPEHGCLIPWAREGVLLLNATLTVTRGQANSHRGQGWEEFTDAVIARISQYCSHVVFLLWGSSAAQKGQGVDRSRHLVLTAPHPSPLSASRGFFGCGHFKQCNEYLKAHGKEEIIWQLPLHLDGDEEL